MERKLIKINIIVIFLAIFYLVTTNGKVIKTNTKIPLEVKTGIVPLNASNSQLLSSSHLLTKLGSNEIDPNVHPIENSNPPLAEEPESPITNEIVPAIPATTATNIEPNPDGTVDSTETNPVNTDDPNPINKFCKCAEYACDCCRSFSLPILPVRAPTCARIRYLGNEKMSIQLKYGDVVLVTRTVSGSKSPPICIPMPGGYNQFCGRVYGLAKGPNDFKACLGFELRADDDVEATLRVSCFKFGAQGFSVSEAEPIPPQNEKDDEDDDDDLFGLGGDDDDEEDESTDDDDGVDLFGDDDDEEDNEEDTEYPSEQESPDYEGFSVLDELFSGGESKKLKGNATHVKSTNKNSKRDTASEEDNSKTILTPQTKDIMVDDGNNNATETNKKEVNADENKNDEDEYDDEEDEDEDGDETDKTHANNKINKEKMSTLDYVLSFVEKLIKLF